jgi:hypothetical protein
MSNGYRVGNLWDKQRLQQAPQRMLGPTYDVAAQGMQGMGWNPSMEQNTFDPQMAFQQAGQPQKIGGNGFSGMDALGLASYLPTIAGDIAMAFKAPEYDTSVEGGDWSGYNLQHGLGDEISRAKAINTDNWIKKSVGQNTLKFAGTGAQIGGSIVPGLGHAIGAGVGAIGGFFTGLFGGRRKKRKAEEQRDQILAEVQRKAGEFSEANIKAKQEQQAKRIALQNIA